MAEVKTIKSQLAREVNDIIINNGIMKKWLSEQLGISAPYLNKLLSKDNFTIEDANRILEPIGYCVQYEIVKR